MPAPYRGLPYVDEQSVPLTGSPEEAWPHVRAYAERVLVAADSRPRRVFGRLWGTDPASGFGVAEEVPSQRLALTGRHRFSAYALVLVLEGGSLRARTYARFPGRHGALYRLLVIGTGGHAVATRAMLRSALAESVEQ